MTREIKFRAWDKNKKYMLPHSCYYQILVGEGSIVSIAYKPQTNGTWKPEEPYHFTNPQTDDIEIMQFTSLKDKNGKEIYEGDIVKNPDGILNKIDFAFGSFILAVGKNKGVQIGKFDTEEWFEVIGNIYENPELLN